MTLLQKSGERTGRGLNHRTLTVTDSEPNYPIFNCGERSADADNHISIEARGD